MPHFQCVTCKTRLQDPTTPPIFSTSCVELRIALERAGDLAELVGFRAITTDDRAAESGRARTRQSLVDRLGGLHERRALKAQARLDPQRGVDQGESPAAQVVALPRPESTC